MDQTRRFETSLSHHYCCSPSYFAWRSKQWLEVREAVRSRCLPGLRAFKAEQSTPEGHKTLLPSIAVSRGGYADCRSGGRERWPLRLYQERRMKKMTTTTTKKTPPSLQMTTHFSLRTKEVQMYQPMLRDRSFFPTHHMQSHLIICRAAPERAAWPTAPLLGATSTPTLLPTQSHHHLPPTTVATQPREGEERDAGWGAAPTTTRPLRRVAQLKRELLGRLIRDDQL